MPVRIALTSCCGAVTTSGEFGSVSRSSGTMTSPGGSPLGLAGASSSPKSTTRLTPATVLSPEPPAPVCRRSEEHTSELQSLMRISYAVFCLKKKKLNDQTKPTHNQLINNLMKQD